MKDYTNSSPSYNSKVPEFETTDKGHADILNQAVEQLANNTFANHDAIDKVKDPTYDTSDTSTITSFPTFLAKFVTGLNIFKFFADLKAGLAYVLHTGNIVNNCVSTSTGNVLDAYQGKVLQDNITAEATARSSGDSSNADAISTLNSKLQYGTYVTKVGFSVDSGNPSVVWTLSDGTRYSFLVNANGKSFELDYYNGSSWSQLWDMSTIYYFVKKVISIRANILNNIAAGAYLDVPVDLSSYGFSIVPIAYMASTGTYTGGVSIKSISKTSIIIEFQNSSGQTQYAGGFADFILMEFNHS